MLTFVLLAYSMMALLMESVPSFLETWIECLGDLARYRMAIEEADLRDREIWSGVARMWYNKAADRSPKIGRIQHHLAVLARPNIVQQLYYYSKALVSVTPFYNARESIMLLFTPFLDNAELGTQKHSPIEIAFVRANAVLFTEASQAEYRALMVQFSNGLDNHIARTSARFRVQGPELMCALIAATLEFGSYSSPLMRLFFKEHRRQMKLSGQDPDLAEEPESAKTQLDCPIDFLKASFQEGRGRLADSTRLPAGRLYTFYDESSSVPPTVVFKGSLDTAAIACETIGLVVSKVAVRIGDKNILPFMHVLLGWLYSLVSIPEAMEFVEAYMPWDKLVVFLNTLGRSGIVEANIEKSEFPQTFSGTGRQLPEDFVMRGMLWAQLYLPFDHFHGQVLDEDERTLELPSQAPPRVERCLWAAEKLARVSDHDGVQVVKLIKAAVGKILEL